MRPGITEEDVGYEMSRQKRIDAMSDEEFHRMFTNLTARFGHQLDPDDEMLKRLEMEARHA